MSGQWQHGLFGCFDDFGLCIITYFVPCFTFGKTNEAIGEDCLKCGIFYLIPFLDCYVVITTRGKIRESKGIPGSFIEDLLIHWFCHLCALVQEAQEVRGGGAPAAMAIERV